MKYLEPTFSVPTGNGRISQTEYEIRVGLRCEACLALLAGGHRCPAAPPEGFYGKSLVDMTQEPA